jgi:hypothetical protein
LDSRRWAISSEGLLLVLAAAASGVYWSARPQLFTLLLTAVSVWIFETSRGGRPRRLWWLVLVSALWVNLHGGFAVLFILLGIYALGRVLERAWYGLESGMPLGVQLRDGWSSISGYVAVGVVSLAALSLNPNGPQMMTYPLKTVSIGVLRQYIQEWQSPNFHEPGMLPFLGLLLVALAVYAYSRRRPDPAHVLLSLVFAGMGLLAARNVALFGLVIVPALAPQAESALEPLLAKIPKTRQASPRLARALNAGLLIVLTLAAALQIAVAVSPAANSTDIRTRLPVDAVAAIRLQAPPGQLFNSYNWGGYVLWSLYPQYPSFVDGRTDLFDDELLTAYLVAWRAQPGWQAVFDEWGIRLVLIEPDAPLTAVLLRDGWRERYRDSLAVVLSAPGG